MITGKSIMSWNVPAVLNGDPEEFAQLLVDLNFEGVLLKAADGSGLQVVSRYSPWPTWGENVRQELVTALRARNLKVYFWHFLYGYNPQGELSVARKQIDRFNPDGYVWNVEGSFDNKPSAEANARLISGGLATSHSNIPQGLCWWALPASSTGAEWHPKRVAKAFLETVTTGMPMMYWQGIGALAATSYFERSLKLWRDFTDVPLTPIGRSYNGDGGYADKDGITAFADRAYEKQETEKIVGTSWYSLDKAVQNQSWLTALQNSLKFGNKVTLSMEEKVDRLVMAHLALFPELHP